MKSAVICATRVTSFYLKNGMDTSVQFDWNRQC
jgi:hypothetical protein